MKKILLVRPDAIGDVVLMIPLINTIKASWPEVQIYTLQQAYTKPLLDNHPAVKEVLLDWKKANKIKNFRDFLNYAQYLKSFNFDAVIFSYLDFFYALLMKVAGIRLRIGDKNRVLLRPLLTHSVKQHFRNLTQHEIEQNISLLDILFQKEFAQKPTIVKTMDIYATAENEIEALTLLKEQGWKNDKLIGIHPATGGGNRAWLAQNYARLIDLIYEKTTCQVAITGFGEKDAFLCQKIKENCANKPLDLVNKTNLNVLKAIIKNCEVFIGTDTGPTHMGAALGQKILSISPTKFVKSLRWGPWRTINIVAGKPQMCKHICNPYKCTLDICLKALTPAMVFKDLERLLDIPNQEFLSTDDVDNKIAWFAKSVNVLFYFNDVKNQQNLDIALKYINILYACGTPIYLACRNKEIKKHLRLLLLDKTKKIFVIPRRQLIKMLFFIAKKDINLIHLIGPSSKLYWKNIIRQIAALFLYCPPMIFNFLKDDIVLPNTLVKEYINGYDRYYS